MKVAQDVLEVLDRSEIAGPRLTLPPEHLDRAMYVRVAKVIELAGGMWNKKAKCHLFAGSAEEAMEPIFLTGEITDAKKEFGEFFTPSQIVNRMIGAADLQPHHSVLEPSAGRGDIALAVQHLVAQVCCVEINPANVAYLRAHIHEPDHRVRQGDFLAMEPEGLFDRVLMNPPFVKRSELAHVVLALRHLKIGGRLVAIMPTGIAFRTDKATTMLRELIESRGYIEPLPEGSFVSSGTSVNTCMVVINNV